MEKTGRSYKDRPGYVSRTIQGIHNDQGGYAQAITLAKMMDSGDKIELYVGMTPDYLDDWVLISWIHFRESQKHEVEIGVETGEVYGARYTDAIRARIHR